MCGTCWEVLEEKDRIDGDTPVVGTWDTVGGHGACGVILLESAI